MIEVLLQKFSNNGPEVQEVDKGFIGASES
jgi:hypothetical protein